MGLNRSAVVGQHIKYQPRAIADNVGCEVGRKAGIADNIWASVVTNNNRIIDAQISESSPYATAKVSSVIGDRSVVESYGTIGQMQTST